MSFEIRFKSLIDLRHCNLLSGYLPTFHRSTLRPQSSIQVLIILKMLVSAQHSPHEMRNEVSSSFTPCKSKCLLNSLILYIMMAHSLLKIISLAEWFESGFWRSTTDFNNLSSRLRFFLPNLFSGPPCSCTGNPWHVARLSHQSSFFS